MRKILLTASALALLAILACGEKKMPYDGAPSESLEKLEPGELPGDKEIKNSEVAYNLALEHAGKGEYEAAHHYIDLAIRLLPNSKYYFVKGAFWIAEGKYSEAMGILEKSLQMGPGSSENRVAVLNAQGVCLKELNRDEEALAKFREVVNTPGIMSRYEAYYNMGIIYIRQGKMDDAEAVFRRVVDENPGYYQAYNKLGLLRGAKEDWPSAALNFRKALEILEGSYKANALDGAEIHYNLGEAFFAQKMYPEARAELLQVLRIAPEGPFGQKAKVLLAQLGGIG